MPGAPDAVAAWVGPEGAEETPERLAASGLDRMPELIGPGPADRFAAMFAHMEGRMRAAVPPPHWYLFILGVDPPRQGQGLGGALLRTGLTRAVADGVPACLLTAQPRNVPFHERHGLRIAEERGEPNSGVRFWVFTTP